MTYREHIQGRIKLDALHTEADHARVTTRIRRKRIGAFLRRLAERVESA